MKEEESIACFVIGPIGDQFAVVGSEPRLRYERAIQTYEEVIEPACAESGIQPVRADRIAQPGEITEQIFRHLRDDFLVIADLTDANPNVMYELGLRHTIDGLTIQVGENGRLPFDIGAIRTILFQRTEFGLIEARNSLVRAIRAGLEQGHDRVTATRIWHDRGLPSNALSESIESAEVAGDDEPGFLDVLAAAEEAYPKITSHLQEAGAVLTDLTDVTLGTTGDIQTSDARGAGAGGRLLIANTYAKTIAPLIERLDEISGAYVEDMRTIVPAINYMLDRMEAEPELSLQSEPQELLKILAGFQGQMRGMVDSMSQFASTVDGLGKISRLLRDPGQRLSRALRRFAEFQPVADQWATRSTQLFETERSV